MKTVAYLRVSTGSQDLATQKLAILEFSQKRRFPIDQFIESRISSRKSPLERRIDEMLGTLQPGDRLLVSELSRLGRSLSQVSWIQHASHGMSRGMMMMSRMISRKFFYHFISGLQGHMKKKRDL